LRDQHGVDTDYLRIRALPINGDARDFLARYKTIYVVDQNRDAQMAQILRGEYPEVAGHVRSIRHYDGLPIDALTVVNQLLEQERN
jgi:2-oxoglutarate/2-oxoacid ferredoxin oxidoreductase subunit alpha